MNSSRLRALLCLTALGAVPLLADPLSKKADIDFFRDASSRGLNGLAARSDGRLVAGPILSELKGAAPAELLWCLEPAGTGSWLVGSGPDGKIYRVTIDAAGGKFTAQEAAKIDDAQVYAVKALPDGSILAGTSPKGKLVLVQGGKVTASVRLPADSVFDLADAGAGTILAATGNPGRIYAVNLAKFRTMGLSTALIDDDASLAAHGVTTFGSIVDRNVRRLAQLTDGSWAAGSSPRGNVYRFGPHGGAPQLLEENSNAEVTDLLPQPGGEFLATIVFSAAELHLERDRLKTVVPTAAAAALPEAAQEDKFTGRSILVRFPADGFPDILTARSGGAYYRLARHGDVVVIAGGEQGDLTGYDLAAQQAINYGGSLAARLTSIAAIPSAPNQYLVLHNNTPGFALLDYAGQGARTVETRSLDFGQPARVGAVRFDRLKALAERKIKVEFRISSGADEREGWSPWTVLASDGDGWRGSDLRGRYFKLRVSLPAEAAEAQLGRAAIYYLPQNRRPQLQEFHYLTPNFGLIAPADPVPPVTTTLSQIVSGHEDDKDKHKDRLLAATVFPALGNEAAFWTVTSTTGDNLVSTLSIRREGDTKWIDVAVETRDNYAQFDISHLPEGVYYTRLAVTETAPRPEKERLSATFETDDLVVDHTPPDILSATVRRAGDRMIISVHGKDALSLLDNLEADFNNGLHENVEQPADGVRDGREETFTLEEPLARLAGATSVELTLQDASGNTATQRVAVSLR